APSLSAAQAGATLRKVGIGNPLPTFAVGVAAYVVALVASVLVIVSLFLAALTLDTGDVTGGAGMSGGGSASPSDGLGWRGFVGSVAVGWRGLPLLCTVAMVATAFLAARFVQRRWGSNGVLGAVLWAGVSGLAVAIFAVIATRVTAFSYEDDSLGASLSMHSAGADMFFGTGLLIGLPLASALAPPCTRDREPDDAHTLARVPPWAAQPNACFAGSAVLRTLAFTRTKAEIGMMGPVTARLGIVASIRLT